MWIPNGNGLVTREGFSIPDGTGYIVRRSHYGCQSSWPGFFRDHFASNPGPITAPGSVGHMTPYNSTWELQQIGNSSLGGTISNLGGALQIVATPLSIFPSGCNFLFYPLCNNIPIPFLTMNSRLAWNPTGDFDPITGTFLDALPEGTGGPCAFLELTGGGSGLRGYFLDLLNKFNNVGVPSHWVELDLRYWDGANNNLLASFTFQGEYVTPNGHTGWTNLSHFLNLIATNDPATGHNIFDCWLDGSSVITYTHTLGGIPQGGNFGFQGSSLVDTGGTSRLQGCLVSSFRVTAP